MNNNEQAKQPYEAPTFEVIGSIHEFTKAGSAPNADVAGGQNNTAFSVAP